MPVHIPTKRTLRTTRMNLEILDEAHAEEMFTILRNPMLYKYMDGIPATEEVLREQYRRKSQNWDGRPISWHNWILRETQTSHAIGYIQATLDHSKRHAELAWALDRQWSQKGYASEATRRIIDELTKTGHVDLFTCTIDERNTPSKHLARSLGFQLTRTAPTDEQTWSMRAENVHSPN